MRIVALIGLAVSCAVLFFLAREPEIDWRVAAKFVGGVIACLFWLFFLQCAGSFRRAAREPAAAVNSLAEALWRLRVFYCVQAIVTIAAAGLMLASLIL
jgi:hypothetical protein